MKKPVLHILVCTNERSSDENMPSCGAGGGGLLYDTFRAVVACAGLLSTVKITTTGCLTPCQAGPNVVVYPSATWYGGVSPSDASEILQAHLEGNDPVERLLLPDSVRII